jgi:hypothetical protein
VTVPSYPAPGYPAPASRSRPTTVTVASYLLYLVAGIQVINALAVFSTSGTMRDAVAEAYRGTDAEGAEGIVVGVLIVGGVINLLIGLGFAVLSYFNSRGKNPSRIVTWVVGGISLCCLGLGLGGTAMTRSMGTGSGTGPSQDEVQRRINEAVPSWYTPLTTTLSVVALLAVLGAVILLALPASNEFFRKPAAAGWEPGMPYPQGYGQQQPPYPGQQAPYPGQPPYPGQQPPYPGQSYPGQQGQPGQPAPGLPPYPGQAGPPYPGQTPPPTDPYAPPSGDDRPPA